ncbi:MAG TPA: hypothetical protein VF163_12610, partial [Micromonosporaceae bacterium]
RACFDALALLSGSGARGLLVIGSAPAPAELPPAAEVLTALEAGPDQDVVASFEPYGVNLQVRLAVRSAPARLPLSLAVAAWLLRERGAEDVVLAGMPVAFVAVPADLPTQRCAAWLAGVTPALPWALLVMADGSACRGVTAPGYDDPRAAAFDETVATALAKVDPVALLGLDTGLAASLRCAGRAPWQVLAGAVAADQRRWHGQVSYDEAPYGVGYLVATWQAEQVEHAEQVEQAGPAAAENARR